VLLVIINRLLLLLPGRTRAMEILPGTRSPPRHFETKGCWQRWPHRVCHKSERSPCTDLAMSVHPLWSHHCRVWLAESGERGCRGLAPARLGRRIKGSLTDYCFLNEFEFRAKLLKKIEMQFHFVLFKTKAFIFYQQLQKTAIIYLLVPSASQESLILLANIQVPSREEIFLKKFDWRGDACICWSQSPAKRIDPSGD